MAAYSSEKGWTTAATAYGSSVGRTSAHAAARLIDLAATLAPLTAEAAVLDVGAGAGAVALHAALSTPAAVTATDLHPQMLERIPIPEGARLTTRVADARALASVLGEGVFSHVLSTFMLQTVTTPQAVLAQMKAVSRGEGSVLGVAVWAAQNDPFEIWERAVQTLDPSYALPTPFDDPHAWRTPAEVVQALGEAGLKDVKTEELVMPFPFEGTDKFLDFWFGAQNPAALRVMSNWDGDREEARRAVAKVCREQYDDGRAVCTKAVLGVGRV